MKPGLAVLLWFAIAVVATWFAAAAAPGPAMKPGLTFLVWFAVAAVATWFTAAALQAVMIAER